MPRPNQPTVELSPDFYDRVRIEAHRRCGPDGDVRAAQQRIVERALAATLGQLEAEDVQAHSRFCRCGSCAPAIARGTEPAAAAVSPFAAGTEPGTRTVGGRRRAIACVCAEDVECSCGGMR
jgi:hypothetical protein